jgi:predicted RNA binding protein YcfA (HicA-like mRNA interferase family)
MSKESPGLRPGEVVRLLEKAGFVRWRQKGSHLTMYRAGDRRALTIPIHFAKTMPKGTLRAIIKQAGLTREEFLALR